MEDWREQFNWDLMDYGMAILHTDKEGVVRNIDLFSEEGRLLIEKMEKIEEAKKLVDRLFNFHEPVKNRL